MAQRKFAEYSQLKKYLVGIPNGTLLGSDELANSFEFSRLVQLAQRKFVEYSQLKKYLVGIPNGTRLGSDGKRSTTAPYQQ